MDSSDESLSIDDEMFFDCEEDFVHAGRTASSASISIKRT